MSLFSTELGALIEARGLTQTGVCEQIDDISQSQLSRYINGENRPTPEMVEKIVSIFEEKEQRALVLAYLHDDLTPGTSELVIISPSGRVAEEPDRYRPRMPKNLRQAFDFLESAAVKDPEVAELILSAHKALSHRKQ